MVRPRQALLTKQRIVDVAQWPCPQCFWRGVNWVWPC